MNKRVVLVGIGVFAFVVYGPLFGQEAAPFKSAAGKFSVLLPGKPKYQSQKLPGTKITQHQFLYESQNGAVAHLAAYQVDPNLGALNKEQKEQMLVKARDAAKGSFKGEVLADKAVTLDGNPGREFTISVPSLKSQYRSRVFIVGDRLYQVTILGPSEVTSDKAADAFLDSFALLKNKK